MAHLSSVDAYSNARASLISQERSLRRDYELLQNASEDEQRAEEIIRRIRRQEANEIWSVEHVGMPNSFPGMEFLSAKHIIQRTKIFRILSQMPKGALLHAHLDGMVDARYLLSLSLKQPAIHVRVNTKLDASTLRDSVPEFVALPNTEYNSSGSLTAEDYVPGTWVSLVSARESFAPELGGPDGLDNWILGAMTINPGEAYGTHNTVSKIWKKFANTFLVTRGLTGFEPIWPEYIREFFRSSIRDGISYIEARVNFVNKYMVRADGRPDVPHREWVAAFERVVNEVKDELKAQGREDEFIGARIIYSTIRFISVEELDWYLEDCIELKKEFPHLIAGFDLVGDENNLKPLIDYIEPLLFFRQRVEELGLELPFILHAGETLGDGDHADNNLYDAILLGTKRIGHGFSIVKHPKLMQICKERDIALEVCPISNEILRLTSSMPAHPLPILLNHGLVVALCSDDPGVFGNLGLSYDFFQVLVASEVTGLITLKGLARQSIQYSTLDDAAKADALEKWEIQWRAFIKRIVDGNIV